MLFYYSVLHVSVQLFEFLPDGAMLSVLNCRYSIWNIVFSLHVMTSMYLQTMEAPVNLPTYPVLYSHD